MRRRVSGWHARCMYEIALGTTVGNDSTDYLVWSGSTDWPGVPRVGDRVVTPGAPASGPVLTVNKVIWHSDRIWFYCDSVTEDEAENLRFRQNWRPPTEGLLGPDHDRL